jgi:predicted nucleotidyltransferase
MSTSDAAVSPLEVRRFFEEKARRRQEYLDGRFAEAWSDCTRILEMIVQEYHPLRVWQWGSLLDRSRFSEISDIDIAVEGVASPSLFFEMYGKALEMSDFPLDLIDLDSIEVVHAESIRQRGRLVHGRD